MIYKIVAIICLLFFAGCIVDQKVESGSEGKSLTKYVNPFIGTDGPGNTYPGAQVPFGMVQLSPDNGRNGWDWIAGYFYPDSVISGFSHTHLSGTGAGDLYDISFMPVSGKIRQDTLDQFANSPTIYSTFDHKHEQASPGYYQVYLKDYNINVELTATMRTGLQRYTYNGKNAVARLDLGYSRNWDRTTGSYIKIVNDTTIVGYRTSTGWAYDQQVCFASIFSKPFKMVKLYDGPREIKQDTARGVNILAVFEFDVAGGNEVVVKTGISSISYENALENLKSEVDGFDFDEIRVQAQEKWENELDKVQIKASNEVMANFYTAMYRTMLAPIVYSDVNGEYRGVDGCLSKAEGYDKYTIFSLWDTFRALHPWYTIVQTERVPDMVNSMLSFYKEYGHLPVWNMYGNETNMMLGYHAVPVIADAYQKGIKGFDIGLAYEAMKKSAMQDNFGLKEYKDFGYVPYENHTWNVSRTLEYAYDDWCIAQVAKLLGQESDYQYFIGRSKNYQHHFDKSTGFMRALDKNGKFRSPFDPTAYEPEDYTEGNAWQYSWFVPHDIDKLVEMHGGANAFSQKLDSLFEVKQADGKLPEWISGYIGQYVHGNEPTHHVAYLYQFVGKAHKTESLVRKIMEDMYTNNPNGLCGNEDCGQMSAWYLFSALGFYPVNPADGRYVLGSPIVEEAKIELPNKKEFIVRAKGQSKSNKWVKSVLYNGKALGRNYITHDEVMNGGELIFEMYQSD